MVKGRRFFMQRSIQRSAIWKMLKSRRSCRSRSWRSPRLITRVPLLRSQSYSSTTASIRRDNRAKCRSK